MSQHDYNIANGGGATVRADINNALTAIQSLNSGATAPTATKPYMPWYDTTTGALKMRNAADTAWISMGEAIAGGGQLAGLRNRVINGGMTVGQRGSVAAVLGSNVYGGADRWIVAPVSFGTMSGTIRTYTGQPTISGIGQGIQITTTGTGSITIQQRIESANVIDMNGKTVTLTMYAYQNSGATVSANLQVNRPTSGVDNFVGGQTGISTSGNVSVPTGTLTKLTYTIALGATDASLGLSVSLNFVSVGAVTAKDFYAGDCQFEVGPVATPFEQRPYSMELALCQRYLPALNNFTSVDQIGVGYSYTTTSALISVNYTVTARVPPTGVIITNPANISIGNGAGLQTAVSAGGFIYGGLNQTMISFTTTGLTIGQGCYARSTGGYQILFTGCEL